MNSEIPHNRAGQQKIGLFIVIAVLIGALTGTPSATYAIVNDQPVPDVVNLVILSLFALSPPIAAVIIVRRLEENNGVRGFIRERFLWCIDVRWHLIVVGLMPILFTVTYLGFIASQGPPTVDVSILQSLLLQIILLGFVFNLIENYGWRGFLQEALQSHVSALVATILVGVIWALWHASLFLPGGQFEGFPVTSFFS